MGSDRGSYCYDWDSSGDDWCYVTGDSLCALKTKDQQSGYYKSSVPCGQKVDSRSTYLLQGANDFNTMTCWTGALGILVVIMGFGSITLMYHPSDTHGHRKKWDQLTDREVNAAQTLGYTQDTWPRGHTVPVAMKTWSQLAIHEKQAAHALGYTPASWRSNAPLVNKAVAHPAAHTTSHATHPDPASDHLEELFAAAQKEVTEKFSEHTDEQHKFAVYGYYMQATEGDARSEKLDISKKRDYSKWQAWAQHKGLSREEAMKGYINLVRSMP